REPDGRGAFPGGRREHEAGAALPVHDRAGRMQRVLLRMGGLLVATATAATAAASAAAASPTRGRPRGPDRGGQRAAVARRALGPTLVGRGTGRPGAHWGAPREQRERPRRAAVVGQRAEPRIAVEVRPTAPVAVEAAGARCDGERAVAAAVARDDR